MHSLFIPLIFQSTSQTSFLVGLFNHSVQHLSSLPCLLHYSVIMFFLGVALIILLLGDVDLAACCQSLCLIILIAICRRILFVRYQCCFLFHLFPVVTVLNDINQFGLIFLIIQLLIDLLLVILRWILLSIFFHLLVDVFDVVLMRHFFLFGF